MANSCSIIPKVKDREGNIVDSRLFKSLLSYSNNRADAVRLYLITKSEKFIKEWNPKLTLDEYEEPTISSLLQKTNISDVIPVKRVLEKLNREIGYYKKGQDRPALWINNNENYTKLKQKAIAFNTNSEFRDNYVATVVKIQDSESPKVFISIKVERRNKLNSLNASKMEYNERLNSRLRDILESKGVTIGALTSLEERMGINGVTDFDQAKAATNGIVELIRLADGVKGEKALPEEFAHFALEALGSSPLIDRLINNIASNNLARTIIGEDYDEYDSLYNNNQAMLAKEAAGKLLAEHLLKAQDIPASPYRTLLQRVISLIKNFFQKLNASDFQKAIVSADKDFGMLARQILNGSIDEDLKVSNIADNKAYYNTTERVTRDKKLLEDIIKNEYKRLKIYEKRNPDGKFSANQRLLIDRLESELEDNNVIEGVYVFMDSALTELGKVKSRLIALQSTPATNINDRAKVLRDVRNYLYSYKKIADNVLDVLRKEERLTDNRYGEKAKTSLNDMKNLLDDLFVDYKDIAMPLFIEFIKPFIGDSIVVPFGKFKGRTATAEQLMTIADEDISFFDRWLDSMADSSSPILKIFDQAVKQSKERARYSTISVSKQIAAATIQLEQAGIKNTDWMFERDSKGNLSGNYISDINYSLYRDAARQMYKELNEKYGKNPINENADKYNTERKEWYAAHKEIVNGKSQPKKSLYGNKTFESLNEAQKTYYNKIMDIKAKLDSYLPDSYTKLNNAVKIRKDLLERVKSSDDVKSGTKQLWESVKDAFIRRTDDTDFGDRATVKDFEGNEVQTLPIYYTKLKEGESPNDISTDVASTLTAYAAMANDFNEMNKIIDIIETGRDLLRDNLEIAKTRGDKPLMEKFKVMGRYIESKVTKRKEDMRILGRLDDHFEMQVYGRYMADEGTFGKTGIDKAKAADFLNRMTAFNSTAVSILSGTSNVITGKVMMRIESFAGEFFTEKNTLIADRTYGSSLPEYLGEIGNRVKVGKLALWDEYFNVMQEYEKDIRETKFYRKTWFTRMFGTSALFMLSNAGEHWMQNRTSLALADAYKMKAPNGKIVSLWEAMEVVPLDPSNKKLGAELKVKQGYTKEDGSTFTEKDSIKFSRKIAAINQRMHGVYNKLDRSAVQRLAIGRIGMMYRKYMKPSLNRRFKSASFNYDLDAWTEGYYKTTGRFLMTLAKDLKETQFNLVANWGNLTPTEKANIKRAMTESGHFLIIAILLGLIEWSPDKERPWLERMAEYQARRLYTELGAFVPSPSFVSQGLTLLKSPAAGVNTLENLLGLTKLLNPYNYEFFDGDDALIKEGRYKGSSRATKLFYESPLFPMNKTIYRGLHPEEGVPFFKQ